jgi:hypothetical protein
MGVSNMYSCRAVLPILCAISCTVVSGCARGKDPDWPKFPLYLADQGVWDATKTVRRIAAKEVLLLPYYSAYNWNTHKHHRVVAKPFLCAPEAMVIVPNYRRGYRLRGILALCPGYLASGVPINFYGTRKIGGKTYQIEYVVKTRDVKEGDRVLLDFKWLLSQKRVNLEPTRNPLTIREDEEHVYALSTSFMTPTDYTYCSSDKPHIYLHLWVYEQGTEVFIDLTPKETKVVNEFIDRSLSQGRERIEND